MKIKSNGLLKAIVPAILIGGGFVVIKSCNSPTPVDDVQAPAAPSLANLLPQELKALGVQGDTSQDTLKTLIGSLNAVRQQQAELAKKNDDLIKENRQLREGGQNVTTRIDQAVLGMKESFNAREQQMQQKQNQLTLKIDDLTAQLLNAGKEFSGQLTRPADEMPVGQPPDGGELIWIAPQDDLSTLLPPKDSFAGSHRDHPSFPTSFLREEALTEQIAAADQPINRKVSEVTATPVYTVPENATLTGSRAMTALLGRVPVNGVVTDPYPFKVIVGKDNLIANGIELPEVEGAIVSGTASGDWTLSCVRGQVNTITFVFRDGTVRTLPKGARSDSKESGTQGGIGWISDEHGIPCISGTRKSNASSYLPTLGLLGTVSAAGDAINQNQVTTQTNGYGGVTSSLTGDAGQAVLGKAISGSSKEITEWVKQRYGQTFDAIYVQPGVRLAVHITRELAIDYLPTGRRVRHDFTLPGDAARASGLD